MSIDDDEDGGDRPELTANTEEERVATIRLERIEQYIEESLAKANPLEAALGAVNGDLLLMEYRIKRDLEGLSEGDPEFGPALDQVAAVVDQYLRVIKQLERFTHLATKMSGDSRSRGRVEVPSERREETPPSEESQI
jgi:hypothetical protein